MLFALTPVVVTSQLPLLQSQPHLKACVRAAVERAVQETTQPAVERSIKIALTTCEQIVKKDFALDPEEFRMRAAAQHMVSCRGKKSVCGSRYRSFYLFVKTWITSFVFGHEFSFCQ